MTIDRDALIATRAARSRVEELEKALDLARANYHTSVRRLYEAGASLRELATGLGVSHQRVHQIVEAATPTRERARSISSITACDFCGRAHLERRALQVGRPVAADEVSICDECLGTCRATLERKRTAPATSSQAPPPASGDGMSFAHGVPVRWSDRRLPIGLRRRPSARLPSRAGTGRGTRIAIDHRCDHS